LHLTEYILLFATALGGGLLYLATRKTNLKNLKLALAFSGAYLFSISIVHLIPSLYQGSGQNVGFYILGGFFLQLILEYFSRGIEHGHIHVHPHPNPSVPYSLMIGLCVHSFLEGMPLSAHVGHGQHHSSLLAGIILHHMPVAFALVAMLSESGIRLRKVILMLSVFAVMTPLGAWCSGLLEHTEILDIRSYYHNIMGIVIGIFLHISTTILFETGSDHKYNRSKILVILCGAALAVFA
jgi:zinc transporter ZupT